MIAAIEHALDAEAHERHRFLDRCCYRLRALALHQIRGVGSRREHHYAQLQLELRREAGGL